MTNPGRPTPDDYAPFYAGYVSLVTEGEIEALLARQLATITATLDGYDAAQAQWRPAPGEWNATEIVGHMADAERVFAYRALCFARGDTTALPGMDQEVFMRQAGFASRPLADVAAEFVTARHATLALIRGFDAAAWARGGVASGNHVTVAALAYIIAGHASHHLRDLVRYPALADAAGAAS